MYGIHHSSKKAKGGPVEGPGTGTSDSIKAQVPAGSYIMPADSTAALGFGSKSAGQQTQPSVPVNLSNGEYQIPPEQVHAVGVQALEQAKAATHAAVAQPQAQGGELFFANGGLVEDPLKKKQTSFDITNTPAAQGARGFSPQGVQGMARDAASKPATGFGQPAAPKPGFADGLAGSAKALVGTALLPHAAVADGLRYGATRAVGGDPESLEGGTGKYRDMATGMAGEGWKQTEGAAGRLRADAREALGVKPLAKPTAPVVGAGASRPSAPGGVQPELPRLGAPGWSKTGIGVAAQGGEIVARAGAGGVPEFSNDPQAVAGAGAMPGAGFGSTSVAGRANMGDGVALAQRGSINNVGNGIGTFSQAEAGDAALAAGRFERANEERAKMIAASRAGEPNGGLTIVGDSSRKPSLQERQLARLDNRAAQTEALRAQTQQSGADAEQRRQLDAQRMSTEQLNQQRLQQQVEEGQYGVQDRQRIAELQARMVDPGLSEEERTGAREAYTALSTQAKDRYIAQDVVMGQGTNGPVIGRQIIDATTGRPVAGAQSQATSAPAGMTLVGYKDGKPVYQDASGKRFMDS